MSFFTPSSPRCSLHPPGVGWVRVYRGEYFRGVAGAELEGYVYHLLRIGSGGRVLLCSVKKNNSDNVEKNFIWPKRYMTIVPVTRLEGPSKE